MCWFACMMFTIEGHNNCIVRYIISLIRVQFNIMWAYKCGPGSFDWFIQTYTQLILVIASIETHRYLLGLNGSAMTDVAEMIHSQEQWNSILRLKLLNEV